VIISLFEIDELLPVARSLFPNAITFLSQLLSKSQKNSATKIGMEVNQVVLFKMAWQTSKNTEVGYQENL